MKTYIQEPLENVERKINIYIEDIRARADAKQTDSNLGFMVNELIRTINWNTLNEINERRKSQNDTGCLLQIAIFAVLGLIGALLQGC